MISLFLRHARRRFPASLLVAVLAVVSTWCSGSAAAGPIEELKTLSGLGAEIDARKLLEGEVTSGRGTRGGDFARGAYVESCYFVRAPLTAVGDAFLHWDPTAHKELEVEAYRGYRWPASPEVFKPLELSSTRASDRALIERTREVLVGRSGSGGEAAAAGELHLSAADLGGSETSDVNAFWRGVLRARSEAFASGGLAAVPTYSVSGTEINARVELRSLVKMTPKIAAHFAPLTEARPLVANAKTAADEAGGYWAQAQVRGRAHLGLGLLCARKSPDSWQVLDSTYFTSGTYYLSVDLYQLWPWENGTLVWQVDYISAPFRSYAIGLDKVLAAREMLKDTGVSIRHFRRDVEQAAQRSR